MLLHSLHPKTQENPALVHIACECVRVDSLNSLCYLLVVRRIIRKRAML